MRYLDYNRLQEDAVDPELYALLVKACRPDTINRVRTAFPEFFTFEKPDSSIQISLADLYARQTALTANEVPMIEHSLVETAVWFSLPTHCYEYRVDGKKQRDCELLPANFKLERDANYNGLEDEDAWIVNLSVDNTNAKEHLVVSILETGGGNSKFFIWTIPLANILFE